MKSIFSWEEMNRVCLDELYKQKTIGFVPTMGALHDGHLALVREAKKQNDVVVVSIFVNPTQFNNPEDYDKYPNSIKQDSHKLDALMVNYLFNPDRKELYPGLSGVSVDFGSLSKTMEGKYRPGHFNGVGLIIIKLLNIIQPTNIYLGLKDYQQFKLVECLVRELNYKVQVVGVPTVREKDGLALSSRNMRLSSEERSIAKEIFKALELSEKLVKKHEDFHNIKEEIKLFLEQFPSVTLEYLEFADAESLEILNNPGKRKEIRAFIACFVGKIRLIDNILIRR
jgi:pantoate--beta-alanine ligase